MTKNGHSEEEIPPVLREVESVGKYVSVRGQIAVGQDAVKRASDEIREGTPLAK